MKIEACPFCRNKDFVQLHYIAPTGKSKLPDYQVKCSWCGACGPIKFKGKAEQAAIASWNRVSSAKAFAKGVV